MSIYVCSDIHGAYNKFKSILKKIKFNNYDHMYILGDIIDRGEESIPLLLDIMERENITVLLGNHEYMMYDAYHGDKFDRQLWHKNGGYNTDIEFLKLNSYDQDAILDFIFHLPIVLPDITVNDQHYYMAHSSYISKLNITGIESISNSKRQIIDEAVWSRRYSYKNIKDDIIFNENKHKTLIAGHTSANQFYNDKKLKYPCHIYKGCHNHYINIDCGCSAYANGNKNGRLGVLRLDDKKEFYA